MKIKSNTLGKLSKIREGTVFSNEYTFVKELLQNSQRGKSKVVNITVGDDFVIFEDNGIGCKDPESLFTLDKSEWITTDEGFGIGFWSCLAFNRLKEIEVISHKWKSMIDIDNLFANEDLSVPIEKNNKTLKGFYVKLTSHDCFSDYRRYDIEKEIEEVAKHLNFDVYLNGNLIEKVDIFENVCGEFVKLVENRFFKAKLKLDESKYGNIKLFYDQRYVCYLYGIEYISGVISCKKDKLTLREPDRSDYVVDGKLDTFLKAVEKEAKKMYIEFLKSNDSDELLEKFSEGINKYLKVSEYEKYVFLGSDFAFDDMLNEDEDKDKCNESEIALSNEEILDTETIEESNYFDTPDNNEFENKDMDNTDDTEEKKELNRDDFKREDFKVTQNPISYIDKKEIGSFNNINESGNSNFKQLKQIQNMAWVYEKEVNSYSDEISLAKYSNLKVYKIKNILQEEVMRKHGKLHISELRECLIEEYDTRNIGIKNKKEENFIKLLIPICKKYNIPTNTFSIANLSSTTKLNINNKIVYKRKQKNTKDKIYTYAICTGSNILLDRNYLKLSKFSISSGRIGVSELSLIMFISKTIAHELAHYLYGTIDNTINHYQLENKIHEEIINMYVMNKDNVLNLINEYK